LQIVVDGPRGGDGVVGGVGSISSLTLVIVPSGL
jgi:hypothetical protein